MSLELFLSAAALVVALVVPYWIFRREVRERIFFEYTGRYSAIMEHLPSEVFATNFDSKALSKDDVAIRWIKAYFDLCSEEIKLHIRHRMRREVWADWEEAIRGAMDSPVAKWARKALGLEEQYRVLRLFIDGKDKGLAEASDEYRRQKTWSDGKYG